MFSQLASYRCSETASDKIRPQREEEKRGNYQKKLTWDRNPKLADKTEDHK